jgi:colanic acid biosynthesis glycosyl transferase WcaI
MRILYLSQWFEPEPNNSKTEAFLNGLKQAGHSLTVATGIPNYPGGKIYPGYRIRPFQREQLMGFDVHRLPLYPSHGRSSIGRILNYGSFFLSALIYGLFNAGRFDLVYVYHPPITVGLAAAIFGRLRRIPFVLEIQDLWPDSVTASGMAGTGRLARILNRLCNFAYRRAETVVVQCPGMKEKLVERGVPASKISVVYNWTDEAALDRPTPVMIDGLGNPALFTLVYAGNLGRAQSVHTLIEAMRLAAARAPALRLLIIGDGVEEENLKALAWEIGASNVSFHPRLTRNEVGSVYSQAGGLIVSLTRQELFAFVIPTKTQAYMAAGRPLLMAVNGDAARLVDVAQAGITVPPEDPEAMADAMVRICTMDKDERERMGANARAYYREHLSFEKGMAATLDVMHKALAEAGGSRPARPLE